MVCTTMLGLMRVYSLSLHYHYITLHYITLHYITLHTFLDDQTEPYYRFDSIFYHMKYMKLCISI